MCHDDREKRRNSCNKRGISPKATSVWSHARNHFYKLHEDDYGADILLQLLDIEAEDLARPTEM